MTRPGSIEGSASAKQIEDRRSSPKRGSIALKSQTPKISPDDRGPTPLHVHPPESSSLRGHTGLETPTVRRSSASGIDLPAASDEPFELVELEATLLTALKALQVRLNDGHDIRPPAETALAYGATKAQLNGFTASHKARYVQSASADRKMVSCLNDIDGVLKLVTRLKNGRSTFLERMFVIKQSVTEEDNTAQDRYFVKSYGHTIESFDRLRHSRFLVRREGSEVDEEAAIESSEPAGTDMETPFRTFLLQGADESELYARRFEFESPDGKLTAQPVNPSALKSTMAWWSDAESALERGAGPLLANGMRTAYADFYARECRVVFFFNTNETGADGQPIDPSARPEALINQTHRRAGERPLPAERLAGGPMFAEVDGVMGWEVMAPPELAGVKASKVDRNFGDLKRFLGVGSTGAGPTVIHLELEESALVALRFDDRGIRSSVIKPSPSWGQHATGAILSADDELDADFDVVSFRGANHGVGVDASGRPVSEVVACTGEAARAMPMITNSNALAGPIRAGLRFLTGQFAAGVSESMSIPANVLNTVLAVGVKVAWVVGQNEVAKVYSRGRGMEGVTSSGGGNIGFGQLAGTVVSMVAAQKFMTLVLTIGKHVLPRFWQSPESRMATFGALMVAPMFEEFGRLGVNMGLQKAIKIPRGTTADFIGVLTASVSRGVVEFMKSRLGSPVNHPVSTTALTLVVALIYNASRGYTAAYALEALEREARGPTWNERVTTTVARFIGRVDHFWEPIATLVLDKIGAIDQHGSTQHSQVARDVAHKEVMTCLTFILDDLSVQAKRGQLWVRHTDAAEALLRKLETTLESTHRALNGIGLSQNEDYLHQVRAELQEIDRAGAFQGMSRTEKLQFLEEEVRAPLQAYIEANKTAARNEPVDPEARPAVRYTEATLTPKVRTERQRAARAALESWQQAEPGSAEVAHFQMSRTGADGRTIQAGAKVGRLFDTPRPMRDGTTWTRDGQAAAHSVTQRMTTHGGLHTLGRHADGSNTASVPLPGSSTASVTARVPVRGTSPASAHGPSTSGFARHAVSEAAVEALRRKKADLPPLSPALAASTQMPAIKYSKESGFFHLLLRFGFTGALNTLPLGKGRAIHEMVMNQLGNTSGDPSKMVRMLDILLVNLAVHHAPKMPGVVKRGVVTLAPYRERTENERQEGAVIPEKVMTDGELAVLTEFMSTTWSAAMGTFFGNGISAGATLDQSQLIYLAQATGVNLTKLTDFQQGELLIMPGAIFRVAYIDANSGKRVADRGEQDLGQIPFFEYVDTSALVRDFDDFCEQEERRQGPLSADRSPAPNRVFGEGQPMVEHRSGNFVKATREAGANDWVYDTDTQWFRKCDLTRDPGRQVLVYVRDEKSYFLGRRLSDSKRVEVEGPPRRARWAFPFISDEAPAGAKDGVHAAIMRRERVVREGNLETALGNPNHATFQRLGDYWNTPGATAHLVQEVRTREQADAIGQRIQAMDLDSPLADKDVDLIASLLTSMYRKRLQIVRPDKTVETFNRTYDFRDLDKDDALMATPSKDPLAPEVTILAGPGGFYVQQFKPDGATLQIKKIAASTRQTGMTLGNLLHAFNHEAFPRSGGHRPQAGTTSLVANDRARTAARETLSELHYFVGVDDLRIKEHLVKAAGEELPPRIPISQLPGPLASRRSSDDDLRHERDLAERGRGLGIGPQRRPTGMPTDGSS